MTQLTEFKLGRSKAKTAITNLLHEIFFADSIDYRAGDPAVFDESLDFNTALKRVDKALDELYARPKPILPQKVGDELEDWKTNNQDGYGGELRDFCGDMHDEIFELGESVNFAYKSEENYCKVIDAFRYDWEAEPEELFYVQTPDAWRGEYSDCGGYTSCQMARLTPAFTARTIPMTNSPVPS